MVQDKRICISCNRIMRKSRVTYKGMEFEAWQCPQCKEKIFTEDLAMKAIAKLEAKKLEKEYVKNPIKIGNSWGMTFPKEMVEVFSLDNPKIRLKVHPDIEGGKIVIDL